MSTTAAAAPPRAVEEARTWFASLPEDKRRTIRTLHELHPAWNLMVLVPVALWAVGATVVLRDPPWPLRLAGYAAIGIAIHMLAILMHEAIHGNLFRRRAADRWASVLLGAPSFFSGTAYRVPHVLHHRHNRTSEDPDEFSNVSDRRWLRAVAFYAWAVIGMPVYLVHVPLNALRRGSARERRDVLLEYGLLAALYGGAVATAWIADAWPVLVQCWLLPAVVAAAFGNVRGWAEHALTVPGHPLTQSRTVTSNRLVSLLMCNLNYHLEHHLFPAMPWYHLPAVHRLLADEYRRAGASIYRSYLAFLVDALRVGAHGVAPKSPAAAAT